MALRKMYDYFFYKLYKSFEAAPSKWLSDWKASFFVLVLEIWLCLSVLNYYSVIVKKAVLSDEGLTTASISIVLVLAAIKYLNFEYQDRWKLVVKSFDSLPRQKNRIGAYVVWTIVVLIFINLVFSFFLLSRVDWK